MVDFKYQDEAMPIQRGLAPESPTGQSYETPQYKYVSEFANISNDEMVSRAYEGYGQDYQFQQSWAKAQYFNERFKQQKKDYEDQAWWKKALAKTTVAQTLIATAGSIGDIIQGGLGMDIAEAVSGKEIGARGPFEFIAKGIDKFADLMQSTDYEPPSSNIEREAKKKAMFANGAAFVAGLHEKLGVKQKPSKSFDFDAAVNQGVKDLELNLASTSRAIKDFLLQGDILGEYVSDDTKQRVRLGDAYLQTFLEADATMQDRIALLSGWEKHLNNFVMMGPQMAAQVAVGTVTGFAGSMLFMAPQIFGAKYRTARENGAKINTAIGAAALDVSMQAPLEAIGMFGILRGIPKSWFKSKALKWSVEKLIGGMTEGVTEWAQSFPDQFTEAMADPDWVRAWYSADAAGKEKMFLARAEKAAVTGVDEAIVGAMWGMVLGGGGRVNQEINRRFNKKVDKIAKERAGEKVSEDILAFAGAKAKAIPTELKTRAEATDVLDMALSEAQDITSEIQEVERLKAMPVVREIEPTEAEEPTAPMAPIEPEEALSPEDAAIAEGLPPEMQALKETNPQAYQLAIDAFKLDIEKAKQRAGAAEAARVRAAKTKKRAAEKTKKAPVVPKRLSALDKIERLWNRLDEKQQAEVKDLYDNVIEPMPDIERYQMMQAGLADKADLEILERPTLEEWRAQPALRPKELGLKGKVYSLEAGRKTRQINKMIDAAYEQTYGKEAMEAEKAPIEPQAAQKIEKGAKVPKIGAKPQEEAPVKPEGAEQAKAQAIVDELERDLIPSVPGAKKGDLQRVDDLTSDQELFRDLVKKLSGVDVAFYTTDVKELNLGVAARTESGFAFNVSAPEAWLLAFFGHESWHEIQVNYPELLAPIRKMFWENINQREYKRYKRELALAYKEQRGPEGELLTEEQFEAEFEADYIGSKFSDTKFLKRFLESLSSKPKLLAKLIEIFNKFLRLIDGLTQYEGYTYLRSNQAEIESLVIDAYTALAQAAPQHPMASPSAKLSILMVPETGKEGPERVGQAAYRHEPTGEVFTGIHHGEAYEELMMKIPDARYEDLVDGFVTTLDRFIDRDESLEIAEENDQLRKESTRAGYLISEDIQPEDVTKLYNVEKGEIIFKGDPDLRVKVVSIISALNNGGDYINLDRYSGDTDVIKSLGFEEVGEAKDFNKYEYKGEIYEPSIIIGRYEAAWNATIKPDGTAGKLLDTVRNEYAARKRGEVDAGKWRENPKKLKAYLERNVRSYRQGEQATATGDFTKPTKNIRVKGGKSEIAMVQISSLRGKEESTSAGDSYFDKLYSLRDGYTRPTDFWEIPTWMARGAFLFKNADAYIVRNMAEAVAYLKDSGYKAIMVSAMDANKGFIKELALNFPGKVVVGGYVDKKWFTSRRVKNMVFEDSMENAASELKIGYKMDKIGALDYRQFKGTETVPRLELSKGCLYKCAFCTVPKVLGFPKSGMIGQQVDSFKNLKFKLVYLNDKTFGQASNHTLLEELNNTIKKYNPEFQGFIIQTTAPDFNKLDEDFLTKSGIKYVELGVESFNDDILKKINKPHREKQIREAVKKIRKFGMKFIPNVMVGLAGVDAGKKMIWTETEDTYQNTIDFLNDNRDIISHLNTYVLATYEGTRTGQQLGTFNEIDNDENVVEKSWLKDKAIHDRAYRRFLKIGTDALEAKAPEVVEPVPEEKTPQAQQSMDLTAALDGTDVTIEVAGKEYVINEKRESVEALIELNGEVNGLERFLKDGGVETLQAKRIVSIARNMVNFPFPSTEETANALLDLHKENPSYRDWYDEIEYLKEVFENEDELNLFVGFSMLAHTSRNKGTLGNMIEYLKFRSFQKAGQMDTSKPFGLVEQKTIERVLAAENIDQMFNIRYTIPNRFKEGEVKVKAFAEVFAALLKNPNGRAAVETVVDIWVNRYFFPTQVEEEVDEKGKVKTAGALTAVQHLRIQRHMREVEALMVEKTGESWTPDQAQAVLWFYIRKDWESKYGKFGQKGYTFDETLAIVASRWAGVPEATPEQIRAFIRLKLRDPSVRLVLDLWSEDQELDLMEMTEKPVTLRFYDAASMPADIDVSGKTRHRTVIETDRIYNIDVDPDNLMDDSATFDDGFDIHDTVAMLEFEENMRNLGWVGIRSGNVTALFEPTRVQSMKRAVLNISSVVSPEVLAVLKKESPGQYAKLKRYQELYDQGKEKEVFDLVQKEIIDIFSHPLVDIRSIEPSEGRWKFSKEASFDVEIDFADVYVLRGLLAEFLKRNAQYEGVVSEILSGYGDVDRPRGIASDQAPSMMLVFKEELTDKMLDKIVVILDNNGIPGSTYSPFLKTLTLHHIKYRYNEKPIANAVRLKGEVVSIDKDTSFTDLYKKVGVNFKEFLAAGGEKGFITNRGNFVDNKAAKGLKETFGKVHFTDEDFLDGSFAAIQTIQKEMPTFKGFGTVWFRHDIIDNDWMKNKKGEDYDKKIDKARTVSRNLGIIAEPTTIAGGARIGTELFKEQASARIGKTARLTPKAQARVKDFVSKKPYIKGKAITASQAAQFETWQKQGINIGEDRRKALVDFNKGIRKSEQAGLFQSISMTNEQAKARKEAYANAPDNLLGFSKDPFIQKGFYDQNYSYTARVEVHFPKRGDYIPAQTFTDEIRGLNRLHAIQRARKNWDGATIKFLDGYKNNERTYRVQESLLVYHGTGAEYAQYDLSYLGTGEGFHAFGWGEYYTEVFGIAEDYARKLAAAGTMNTFKITLPILDMEGIEKHTENLQEYTIYESGLWTPQSGRTALDRDTGKFKFSLVGMKEVSTRAWARNEVGRYIKNNIMATLADLDKVTENDVKDAIRGELYDLSGELEYVRHKFKITDDKIVYQPGLGDMSMQLIQYMESEVYEWEKALESPETYELNVSGGVKIVHKVKLDDELKFIDWYRTVPKKDQGKIIDAVKAKYGNISNTKMEDALGRFLERIEDNPTLPLLKDIYHEMVTLFSSKKEASMVLQEAGWDGIRYESDSLYGKTPLKVETAQVALQDELYKLDMLAEIPVRLRDPYHTMKKLVDRDPDYMEMVKPYINMSKVDAVHDAIDNEWAKNYVVFYKAEDPNFVQISDKIYLSLDMFKVQNDGSRDWLKSKVGGNVEQSFAEKVGESIHYFVGDKEDMSNWRYLVFDKLDPIKQWLGGEGHAYMKARGVPGSIGSLAAFLEQGLLEWDNTMTIQVQKDPETGKTMRKKGFNAWIKSLGPNDGVKFWYWLIAKRAEYLSKPTKEFPEGREYWLNEKDRNRILEWVGMPENKQGLSWEQVNEQFQTFNKNILDIATKAGVINAESRKTWESELYIPFFRVLEDPILKAEFMRGPTKGKTMFTSGIKQLKGSEAKIGDPVENIMRNWVHLLTTSIGNVARYSGVKYAEQHEINSGYTRTIEKNKWVVTNEQTGVQYLDEFDTLKEAQEYKVEVSKPGMVRGHEYIKVRKTRVKIEEEIPLLEQIPFSDTVVYKPQKDETGKKTGIVYVHKKSGEGLLSYLVGGKQYYFKVNNPELYIAMSGVNPHQFSGALMEFFRTSKRWLTYGVTFGPGFKIANMLRDTMHTALISKSFIPFWDTARGFVHAWAEDEAYVNYMASGHAFGGHYVESEDPKLLAKYIKQQFGAGGAGSNFYNRLTGKEGPSLVGRVLDAPGKALSFWEKLGAASENAARIQLAENLMAKGVGTATAYFKARDLMDFQLSGASGIVQILIQTIPFLNARAQGLYKMGRAAHESPVSFATKGALISLASLALWLIYKDDERYKKLEDWEKFAYYHFFIGDYDFRIPKPFETGVIFSTSVEAAANVMAGDEDLEHLWTYMKHALTETFAFNPILGVQGIKPLAEQWANKVSFTGRPIEGQGMSGLKWGERYDPWTSETMRLVGETLNLPPKRMEHLVKGYTGTFGMFFLGLADIATRNLFDFPERPAQHWNEYPGVGRFIRSMPQRNTKHMTKFYDLYNEFDQITKTVNYYKKLGHMTKARELATDNKAYLKLKKLVSKRQRELADINRSIRQLWLNKAMEPTTKRKRIDQLTEQRNKLVEQIYKLYKKES